MKLKEYMPKFLDEQKYQVTVLKEYYPNFSTLKLGEIKRSGADFSSNSSDSVKISDISGQELVYAKDIRLHLQQINQKKKTRFALLKICEIKASEAAHYPLLKLYSAYFLMFIQGGLKAGKQSDLFKQFLEDLYNYVAKQLEKKNIILFNSEKLGKFAQFMDDLLAQKQELAKILFSYSFLKNVYAIFLDYAQNQMVQRKEYFLAFKELFDIQAQSIITNKLIIDDLDCDIIILNSIFDYQGTSTQLEIFIKSDIYYIMELNRNSAVSSFENTDFFENQIQIDRKINEELKDIVDYTDVKDSKLKYFYQFTSPFFALSYFIDKKLLSNNQTENKMKDILKFEDYLKLIQSSIILFRKTAVEIFQMNVEEIEIENIISLIVNFKKQQTIQDLLLSPKEKLIITTALVTYVLALKQDQLQDFNEPESIKRVSTFLKDKFTDISDTFVLVDYKYDAKTHLKQQSKVRDLIFIVDEEKTLYFLESIPLEEEPKLNFKGPVERPFSESEIEMLHNNLTISSKLQNTYCQGVHSFSSLLESYFFILKLTFQSREQMEFNQKVIGKWKEFSTKKTSLEFVDFLCKSKKSSSDILMKWGTFLSAFNIRANLETVDEELNLSFVLLILDGLKILPQYDQTDLKQSQAKQFQSLLSQINQTSLQRINLIQAMCKDLCFESNRLSNLENYCIVSEFTNAPFVFVNYAENNSTFSILFPQRPIYITQQPPDNAHQYAETPQDNSQNQLNNNNEPHISSRKQSSNLNQSQLKEAQQQQGFDISQQIVPEQLIKLPYQITPSFIRCSSCFKNKATSQISNKQLCSACYTQEAFSLI